VVPARGNADEKFQGIGLKNGLAFICRCTPSTTGSLEARNADLHRPAVCITREQLMI